MDIKGYGTISINKGGKIEKIPFTNAIDADFLAWAKTKFKQGNNASKIETGASDFEFIFNNGSNNFSYNGATHTSLRNGNGTVTFSLSGSTMTFKWDHDTDPVYWAISDTNPLTVSSIKLKARYGGSSNKLAIGNATISGGNEYDYNDYVSSVEYSLSVSMTGSNSATVLTSERAANSLIHGSSADSIKPNRLVITTADSNTVLSDGPADYSDGQVTVNDLQIQNSSPPAIYQLWVDTSYRFDEGTIALSNPSVQDNAWLSGDTINFQYSTDAFD